MNKDEHSILTVIVIALLCRIGEILLLISLICFFGYKVIVEHFAFPWYVGAFVITICLGGIADVGTRWLKKQEDSIFIRPLLWIIRNVMR